MKHITEKVLNRNSQHRYFSDREISKNTQTKIISILNSLEFEKLDTVDVRYVNKDVLVSPGKFGVCIFCNDIFKVAIEVDVENPISSKQFLNKVKSEIKSFLK